MYTVVSEHVFPFLSTLGGDDSTYAHHMKDARFTIPTPGLLAKVVDLLDGVPMEDRDTKGDIYEYMLAKIATAGQNGQFRTPRHIIRLMVEMTAPNPKDVICDPACGTCGFLVAAGEYLRKLYSEILHDSKQRAHFHQQAFHGFDFDNTMLRIGSMNMLLHGVENPDIRYRDSLAQDHAGEEERYTLVLANPPFAGSLDYENTAKDLLQIVKTKKTELLFVALFLRLLKPGGRAAVIVPDGVLFRSSKAHKELRRMPGDLLFSRANTTDLVGAVAYVEATPPNVLLPDKLWRFVWREPLLANPLFVWSLFQTTAIRREIGRRATGTSGSMKNISQAKVFGIATILPPLSLQRDFARRVAAVEKLKTAHRASLAEMDALFASLQYRAFRGEL